MLTEEADTEKTLKKAEATLKAWLLRGNEVMPCGCRGERTLPARGLAPACLPQSFTLAGFQRAQGQLGEPPASPDTGLNLHEVWSSVCLLRARSLIYRDFFPVLSPRWPEL